MIGLLINLLIVLLVAGVLVYIVRLIVPALDLPAGFVNVAIAIILLIVVVWLIAILTGSGTLLVRVP